jgi:riboflavin synthase alpha subunit
MVFTGIVEEMGTVVSMAREDDLLLWCAPRRGRGCVHSCPWL